MSFFLPNSGAFPDVNSGPVGQESEHPVSEQPLWKEDLTFFYVPPVPTQQGPEGSGIYFDFNFGCRIFLPSGDWHVIISDEEKGHVFGNTAVKEGLIESQLKYFIPFNFKIFNSGELIMDYRMDLFDQPILLQLDSAALGDTLAWLPGIVRFQQQHQCHLTCWMNSQCCELLGESYPYIRFVDSKPQQNEQFYASYMIMPGLGKNVGYFCPVDGRQTPLHHISYAILGLEPENEPAAISLADDTRPLEEPYVCIAVQSTAMCKQWNNPAGWLTVVNALKSRGYRVICIDLHPVTGFGLNWNALPNGAEDQTGARPLSERLRWLKHAEFFVGLASGLSWLAWSAGIPVVLISGFSAPFSEFPTPWRVINRYVCNSCWNDSRFEFDREDYLWCPRNKGTKDHFVCTRSITPEQVINTIATIPELHF